MMKSVENNNVAVVEVAVAEKAKKPTKRQYLHMLREVVENEATPNQELIDFIDHEVEILDRKRSSSSKRNIAKEAEYQELSAIVLKIMADFGSPLKAGDIARDSRFMGLSGSKATAVLTKLKNEGKVINERVKRDSLYRLA